MFWLMTRRIFSAKNSEKYNSVSVRRVLGTLGKVLINADSSGRSFVPTRIKPHALMFAS